jgi:hypothetical protein
MSQKKEIKDAMSKKHEQKKKKEKEEERKDSTYFSKLQRREA